MATGAVPGSVVGAALACATGSVASFPAAAPRRSSAGVSSMDLCVLREGAECVNRTLLIQKKMYLKAPSCPNCARALLSRGCANVGPPSCIDPAGPFEGVRADEDMICVLNTH
jgi:hypothetical protein